MMIWKELGVKRNLRLLVLPFVSRILLHIKMHSRLDIQKLSSSPIPLMDPRLILFLIHKSNESGSDFRVLEFGSGQSSIYFASKGWKVTSIEHERHWFNYVTNGLDQAHPHLSRIIFSGVDIDPKLPGRIAWGKTNEKLWENYVQTPIKHCPRSTKYDLVISDGGARKQVLKRYGSELTKNGFILFHDATMEEISSLYPANEEIDTTLFYLSNDGADKGIFRGATFTLFFKSEEARDLARSQLATISKNNFFMLGPLGNRNSGLISSRDTSSKLG